MNDVCSAKHTSPALYLGVHMKDSWVLLGNSECRGI